VEEPVLLLVEDDALVVTVAEDALKLGGYAVTAATTGTEAFSALDAPSAKFAGLVTDIGLGHGPDGWEVARHAREHQADMPIVYMTAESAGEWPTHGVPNSLLVQKPNAPAQLLAAIAPFITAADTSRATSEPPCDPLPPAVG
jgi:CheY-like chemotaxis protein